jgi:5,6-dimethylbenzimidazole synthase
VADLYETIHGRRDVRREFTSAPLPQGSLERILAAAHAAPSVGLSQPWDFVIVSDRGTREAFSAHVQVERARFMAQLDQERSAAFANIKIDGVLESTLSIVVTYDAQRGAPYVLGRHTIDDAGLYSVCLAIQNLWLAATAEGLGVGWVSFCREEFITELLQIPDAIRPIAWLCVGPVVEFARVPDLEAANWRSRKPLSDMMHYGTWDERIAPDGANEIPA